MRIIINSCFRLSIAAIRAGLPGLVLALLASITSGCRTAAPLILAEHQAVADRVAPGHTLDELERGRQVLVRRCSGCHAVPVARERDLVRWGTVLQTMKGKAKLSDEDEARLVSYLTVVTDAAYREPKR